MPTVSQISVAEYLRTSSDPDCEYVNGVIEERAVGELDHAAWQKALIRWFGNREREWGVFVYPELRVQVDPTHFRVPDVSLISRQAPREQVVTISPLAVFEILSPEDTMARMLEKLSEYEGMGIGAIWLIEPKKRTYFLYKAGQLLTASTFELPGSSLRVPLSEIAALID